MTQQFENFVNAALDKSLASDVTLPTANEIPVYTGIGRQVTGKTTAELGLASSTDITTINTTLTNKADLVDGVVPSSQLPSYVDDVLEYPNLASFPVTGESAKVYVAHDTSKTYRWSGSTYVQIGSDLALGETPSTAYRGDRGKTAYDHSQSTGNPHGATTANITDSTDKRYVTDAQQTRVNTAASSGNDGYLTSTDWTTFNGKQAALADVITADTYGNSTQYPVITFNAKGIATGVTLQTVPAPTFTDATFSVQKNGSPSITASWVLTALTTSRTHTYPNADINFGNLSSVAKTDSNNLSGTRTRILGGSSNTVSGSDNIAIGCSDGTSISGSGRVVAISANRFNTSSTAAFAPNSIVLGTSVYDPSALGGPYLFAGAVGVQTALCTMPVTASGAAYPLTSDGETPTYTNCLPALLYGGSTFMSARHEFDIIIVFGEDFAILPSRTFYAKRTVYVARRVTSGTPLNTTPVLEMSTATPQSDVTLGLGSNTVTIDFTLVDNRLIPTVAVTTSAGFQRMQVSCRVESHYNCK